MEIADKGSNPGEVVGIEGSRGWSGGGVERVDGVVLRSERESPQLGTGGVSPSFKEDGLVVLREDIYGVAIK